MSRSRDPLAAIAADFDFLAETDPFWGVLHEPEKRRGRWDFNEFLATGQKEIQELLRWAASLGRPEHRRRALDFGCGVGRVTRALSPHFEEVVGVDASSKMIQVASSINRDTANVKFLVNSAPHLGAFGDSSFDLIYTNKVLQHVPNTGIVCQYLREFVRVVTPDGLIAAEIPQRLTLRYRLFPRRRPFQFLKWIGVSPRFLTERLGLYPLRLLAMSERDVSRTLGEAGAKILAVDWELSDGPVYFAAK